jgi:serine protease Do
VPERSGLLVTGVKDGSPAAAAGIQAGDVILQADRKPVATAADFGRVLAERKAGEPVLLWIRRKDASLFVVVNLGGGPQG